MVVQLRPLGPGWIRMQLEELPQHLSAQLLHRPLALMNPPVNWQLEKLGLNDDDLVHLFFFSLHGMLHVQLRSDFPIGLRLS